MICLQCWNSTETERWQTKKEKHQNEGMLPSVFILLPKRPTDSAFVAPYELFSLTIGKLHEIGMERGSWHLRRFLSISIVTPGRPVFNSNRPWFNYSSKIHIYPLSLTQHSTNAKEASRPVLESFFGGEGVLGKGWKCHFFLPFPQLQNSRQNSGKFIFHENTTRWHKMACIIMQNHQESNNETCHWIINLESQITLLFGLSGFFHIVHINTAH